MSQTLPCLTRYTSLSVLLRVLVVGLSPCCTLLVTAQQPDGDSSSSSFAPPTIGSKLDAAIESLSSTQLYALIVSFVIGISWILLGSPDARHEALWNQNNNEKDKSRLSLKPTTTTTTTTTTSTASSSSAIPEPRWHWFRIMNYAIVGAFGWSIAQFSHSSDNFLFWCLLVWSVFLCYFFGFFGVTFVHESMQQTETNNSNNNNTETSETRYVLLYGRVSVDDLFQNCTSYSFSPLIHTLLFYKCRTKKSLDLDCTHPVCTDSAVITRPSAPQKTSSTTTTTNIPSNLSDLTNDEICQLVIDQKIKDHELEKRLDDKTRAVAVRRLVVQEKLAHIGSSSSSLDGLPYQSYNYQQVYGSNCEIVIGYVPLPVGLVGPLLVNGRPTFIPMATTEGCLVASTNRGCKAITAGGGATAVLLKDGITRAPCLRMPTAQQAAALANWCREPANFAKLQQAFESTTSFGKLRACQPTVAGRNVYLRLTCFSGDAMGMNMVSKGSLAVIECLSQHFGNLELVALSGNMCTDKKAAATNWLEGRGKSIVVEATIPASIVKSVLKTTVSKLVETNLHKNLIGSAMAGTIGGFNAHASNIVTAIFLATGQDPAQNVESSNCITLLEEDPNGDLWISCTMPSIEVGTVGGGTSLEAQAACLDILQCRGAGNAEPGEHAQRLAQIVASATMAGELSLLAALAANTLVQAHMQHNRKKK